MSHQPNYTNNTTERFGCFRGSSNLPPLEEISRKFNLKRVVRIENRSKGFLRTISNSGENKLITFAIELEKKIERRIRSKSHLDSLFELSQHNPWRGCHKLWVKSEEKSELFYLDFKNFYPSLLCSSPFPAPNKLRCYKTEIVPKEPGMVRVILHPKKDCPNIVRELHPFVIQSSLKGCPFYIDKPIETMIHTNESKIWEKYFELEPLEAITSEAQIEHPLKNKLVKLLEELEVLREKDPESPRIQELKLLINCATTTPKLNQSKNVPSPYGVHCFPSQIISNGKAILFDTIHKIVSTPDLKVLQINTDGFLLQKCNKAGNLSSHLPTGLMGKLPGQLCLRAEGDEAFLLGPNTWWLLKDNKIVSELGTGRNKATWNISQIPTHTFYQSDQDKTIAINLLHLADFRHKLNPESGERHKFHIKQELLNSPLTPYRLIEEEKKRSWQPTNQEFKKFRNQQEIGER